MHTMSWRRFCVMVRCLSPNSATVTHINSHRYIGKKRESVAPVIGAKAADDALRTLYAGQKAQKARQRRA